jgi:hypothetical protein
MSVFQSAWSVWVQEKQLIVGKLFGSGFRNRNKSLRIQMQDFFGEKQYFDNLFAKDDQILP